MPALRESIPPPEPKVLIALLADRFGLRMDELRPLDKGEETLKLIGRAGGRSFLVTVFAAEETSALTGATRLCVELSRQRRPWLVPPLAARDGSYLAADGPIGVQVRRFVEGETLDLRIPSPEDWTEIGRVIGDLHASSGELESAATLGDEGNAPVADEMARVLALAAAIPADDPRAAEARLAESRRSELETLAAATDDLGSFVAAARPRWVVTHGNATGNNLVREHDGQLYLIDWSTASLAPAERDLVHFLHDGFESFLAGYAEYAPTAALEERVLAYYLHRWRADGVTYFGRRLFAGSPSDERTLASAPVFRQFAAPTADAAAAGVSRLVQALRRPAAPPDGQGSRQPS